MGATKFFHDDTNAMSKIQLSLLNLICALIYIRNEVRTGLLCHGLSSALNSARHLVLCKTSSNCVYNVIDMHGIRISIIRDSVAETAMR